MRHKKILIMILASFTLIKSYKYLKSRLHNSSLLKLSKSKLRSRNSQTPSLPLISPITESQVLSLSVSELSVFLKSGQITSTQIVSTYIKRAYTLGRSLSLTAEENFLFALKEAQKCDEETLSGHCRGPLHGIPISVKDLFCQKGFNSSYGLAWKLGEIDKEDAVVVQLLQEQGAIPFVRTNMSQAALWVENFSKIYGRSENPWDRRRLTGGSSGGEGGLVAARASPLGIGSDIGGSVRTPSAFCGNYGFKPTAMRVSSRGRVALKKLDYFGSIIRSSPGPHGRCVDDLVIVLKCWMSSRQTQLDPSVVPALFDVSEFESDRKLKIGYFFEIEGYPVAECIKTAIKLCVGSIKGCEVVPYSFTQAKDVIEVFLEIYSLCITFGFKDLLQGEDPDPDLKGLAFTIDHPFLFKIVIKVLEWTGNKRLANFLNTKKEETAQRFVEVYQRLEQLISEIAKDWENKGIDAVICPSVGTVAPFHGDAVTVTPALAYHFIMNALNMPCGVVPVGLVKKGENFYKDQIGDLLSKACDKVMRDGEGLPYAVQVFALPYRDEVALRVMKKVEDVFNFHEYGI